MTEEQKLRICLADAEERLKEAKSDLARARSKSERLKGSLRQIAEIEYRGFHELNSAALGNARSIARTALECPS